MNKILFILLTIVTLACYAYNYCSYCDGTGIVSESCFDCSGDGYNDYYDYKCINCGGKGFTFKQCPYCCD